MIAQHAVSNVWVTAQVIVLGRIGVERAGHVDRRAGRRVWHPAILRERNEQAGGEPVTLSA